MNTKQKARNTIDKSRAFPNRRVRGWSLTIYTQIHSSIDHLKSMNCKAIGFQTEICPKTKRKHIQGFVYWKNGKSFKAALAEIGCGAHIEAFKKCLRANINYCKKDNSWDGKIKYLREDGKLTIDIDNSTALVPYKKSIWHPANPLMFAKISNETDKTLEELEEEWNDYMSLCCEKFLFKQKKHRTDFKEWKIEIDNLEKYFEKKWQN